MFFAIVCSRCSRRSVRSVLEQVSGFARRVHLVGRRVSATVRGVPSPGHSGCCLRPPVQGCPSSRTFLLHRTLLRVHDEVLDVIGRGSARLPCGRQGHGVLRHPQDVALSRTWPSPRKWPSESGFGTPVPGRALFSARGCREVDRSRLRVREVEVEVLGWLFPWWPNFGFSLFGPAQVVCCLHFIHEKKDVSCSSPGGVAPRPGDSFFKGRCSDFTT